MAMFLHWTSLPWDIDSVSPNGPRCLFISPLLAMPQQHGGCVYPDAVLRAMHSAGMAVDYLWLAWPLRDERAIMRDPLRAAYVRRGFVPGTFVFGDWRVRALRDWWRRLHREAPGAFSVESTPGPNEQSFVRRLLHCLDVHAVLIDFATTLPVLDGLSVSERSQLRVAVLTHNLISRRTELYRERGIPLDFRGLARHEEAALLRRADLVVAIQESEAVAFRELVPDRRIAVVPMPAKAAVSRPDTAACQRCLFVGGYSGHNLDGLNWFLQEVWPMVLARNPDAELDVVGTVGEAVPSGVPNVHAHGQQQDLAGAYDRAAVCVVPLRFGTGLKIKLVEAMAHGRAVVSTRVGAEGFSELEAGTVVTVVDSGAAMADAIVRLLCDVSARRAQIDRQDAWLRDRLAEMRVVAPLVDFFWGSQT